jgi:transposase-like protein
MICPQCGSGLVVKKGFSYTKHRPIAQRYRCKECGHQFLSRVEDEYTDLPKILLMDIETSLYHVSTWGTYKQYIQHYQITKHQYILSWSAKWLFDKNVQGQVVTPEESLERNDKRIVKSIWNLLDQADIIIGHNVERFDLRKLNWRFISLELSPPTPYKIVDTLKVARKEFFAPSYKQDFLTKYFKLQNKLDTEFQLWKECENGNIESLNKMLDYNKHDVIGLEQLYLKLRPYIKNHPNLGVLLDEDVCPNCGSYDLVEEIGKYYFTTANKFPVYRCANCKTPYIRHKKNSNMVQTNIRSVPK